MKTITTTSLLASIALALPAAASEYAESAQVEVRVSASDVHHANTALLKQVSDKITAEPAAAPEVVKQSIIKSKASAGLVLQIVKVAVLTAPEQAEAIHKVAATLAPDAEAQIEMVIASVLQGDQVAAVVSDAANAARDQKKNASVEPEGDDPAKNVVWLTNYGALIEGADGKLVNNIASKVQNTASSPNANHNQGASVHGGTTVVIRTTPVVVPPTTPTLP